MKNIDIFEEFKMSDLAREQLETVISTRSVKARKSDGTCRCRIVVRWYDQVVDDPDETYASTPSLLTSKTLLTLAIAHDWHAALETFLRHFFMRGWKEMIWVLPPVGYYPEGDVIWKFKSALYGLKNAPKLWQLHLAATIESQGFRRMKSDPNLYYNASRKVSILCYVDD